MAEGVSCVRGVTVRCRKFALRFKIVVEFGYEARRKTSYCTEMTVYKASRVLGGKSHSRYAFRLYKIGNIHGHLVDLGRIKLFNIPKDPYIIILDKVDRNTLATKSPRAPDSVNVKFTIVR